MIETLPRLQRAQTIHYDQHAQHVLANNYLTLQYKELSRSLDFAAVLFGPDIIDDQLEAFAADELANTALDNTVYVVMLNGGVPFGGDIDAAMRLRDPNYSQEDAAIKVSATNGATIGTPDIVYDHPGNKLERLKTGRGKHARLKDDGTDTHRSIEKAAGVAINKYGFASASGLVALAKYGIDTKPEERVFQSGESKLTDIRAMFTTPFGPWGEGYGLDNKYSQAPVDTALQRVIGISMLQLNDPENLRIVEASLKKIGGTDGLATATMDNIIRWNEAHNPDW